MDQPSKIKIYHGPVNIAGIGRHLADWQRKQGVISDFITWNDHILGSASHFNFNLKKYNSLNKIWQIITFFILCIFRYNIFHFYFGRTLIPFNLDLPILKLFRKKILMTYCGSDCRLVEIEQKRNPYNSLLRIGLDHPKYDKRKKIMMFWHNLWVDIFFAPRNAFAHANSVIESEKISKLYIHNSMDISKYTPTDFKANKVPLLIHAPSEHLIKGSKYVERAINELKNDGYNFKFKLIQNIPYEEAHKIYQEEADIFIDQFILGGLGTFAVEGMYYGKPVVSYLIESVKEEHFPDCPVVNATIDNLKVKLAWLIDNPDERIQLGKAGRAWVEKNFDSEKINQQLWDLYHNL